MFYIREAADRKSEYIDLLKEVGSLSNLFSENPVPYLYYRAAENIFCRAFNAENLSRGDVSADAAKNKIGIGLKTFMHGNGKTLQKVAEFNKDANTFEGKEAEEIATIISEMRNDRLQFTERAYGLNEMIYHMVTREEGKFHLFEEPMDHIDLSSLKVLKRTKNAVSFKDRHAEYNFYIPKSTLFKRFITDKAIETFDVDILKDPFTHLLNKPEDTLYLVKEKEVKEETFDYVYLPLYSPNNGEVHISSGLNQWNAKGRKRHHDELYIPVPVWIHRDFKDFFPYQLGSGQTGTPFTLKLPDGIEYTAKICQENGKALMTNPNRLLGHWLLRHVLQIPVGKLVTIDMLESIGIDSVKLTKLSDNKFRIDFAKVGSYEQFENEFKDSKK
ncbi:restriction endonuclease [Anaerobacillus arseniciselenatis]|uniref:Restriction endonuclease n=1 Tax=Anaerobacillus arseniciselenatis TaxID=85682 RepID=A0A1S2LA74_9BACI|nr:restriction endonuclease PLD domain-containing protein [Anaerobacillus arseniciselenatis]OIJ09311.1 restriction endonuclease [Anaerobacillus arseniciselenatis]